MHATFWSLHELIKDGQHLRESPGVNSFYITQTGTEQNMGKFATSTAIPSLMHAAGGVFKT